MRGSLLLLVLATAGVAAAWAASEQSANACSRPDTPEAGEIRRVEPATKGQVPSPLPVPKDGAILLVAQTGELSEDLFRARVKVSVTTATGTVLSGALVRADDSRTRDQSIWAWQPVGKSLPVGVLKVRIVVDGNGNGSASPGTLRPDAAPWQMESDGGDGGSAPPELGQVWSVDVEDRLLELPKVPISLSMKRGDVESQNAPQIQCTRKNHGCGGGDKFKVSTRRVGVPSVVIKTAAGGKESPFDRSFFRESMRVFSRDGKGTTTQEAVQNFLADREVLLTHADEEYCVALTITSLMDKSRSETTETCVPHGSLDISIDDDDMDVLVRESLSDCDSAQYPDGYSADDPADVKGCSIGRAKTSITSTPFGMSSIVLLLGALARARGRAYRRTP